MIYLDNSATSFPKPEEVYAFMDGFYRSHGVNPGRSGCDLAREAGVMVDDTRTMLTRLFHGEDPNRLCFSANATDALNLVISGVIRPGDHVLTTRLEHNSVLRPLHHMQLFQGVDVDYLPCDAGGVGDPDEFRKHFRTHTRLVVLTHASNVIGTIQPVAEIGALCREAGILFAVDASQTAGRLPIDVERQNIDILVFTGHKSLMGPTGVGGLYVREGVEIQLTRAGGTGVRSAMRTHLAEYPYRLEYGTINLLGVAGLNAGVRWVEAQGLEAIHQREMDLCTRLRDGIRDVPGVTTYCQDDLSNHIAVFLFNIAGFEARTTDPLFDVDHGVVCRTGLHCAPLIHQHLGTADQGGAIRFSLGPFTTAADIDAAIDAVADIAAMRN